MEKKEYRCGNIALIYYEDNSFEIWNKDGFVAINKEDLFDYSSAASMAVADQLRKHNGI